MNRPDVLDTTVSEVSKGHAVLTDKDVIKVVSYTIKDLKEPVTDREELALVEVAADEDPMTLRRRIREKASVACLRTHEEEEEEKRRVNLFRVLYDEEQHLLGSEPREVPALQRGLAPFRAEQEAEATRPLEDEVLQTRIIPNEEVFMNTTEWIEAIVKEIKSLEAKKAIKSGCGLLPSRAWRQAGSGTREGNPLHQMREGDRPRWVLRPSAWVGIGLCRRPASLERCS